MCLPLRSSTLLRVHRDNSSGQWPIAFIAAITTAKLLKLKASLIQALDMIISTTGTRRTDRNIGRYNSVHRMATDQRFG
jgi:hypothetical protein